MVFAQAFGLGVTTIGAFAVIASIVSPEQGGTGTIVLGVALFFVGIAVFVLGGGRGSKSA